MKALFQTGSNERVSVPSEKRFLTTAEWSAPSLETVRENGTNQPVRSGSKTWTTVEDALASAIIIEGAQA